MEGVQAGAEGAQAASNGGVPSSAAAPDLPYAHRRGAGTVSLLSPFAMADSWNRIRKRPSSRRHLTLLATFSVATS